MGAMTEVVCAKKSPAIPGLSPSSLPSVFFQAYNDDNEAQAPFSKPVLTTDKINCCRGRVLKARAEATSPGTLDARFCHLPLPSPREP